MEGEAGGEFQDWEVLPNSDSDLVNSPNSADNSRNLEEIEADSDGVIRLDYFSLENNDAKPVVVVAVDAASEEGSVESDNPSWIDPGSESRYPMRNSGEFWSDSGSDRSDERKFGDFNAKNELGFEENGKTQVGFDRVGEIEAEEAKLGLVEGKVGNVGEKTELGFEESVKSQVGFEGFGETYSKDKDLAEFWSGSGGEGSVFGDVGKVNNERSEVSGEVDGGNESKEGSLSIPDVEERKLGSEVVKRKVVWWKVPFEVLKYCVFRVSPIWSFSMAAAMVGFVILGRRLYKMKHKARGLQLKVTVDDKKVSQVMSRAARLNEAFSVVRRVPIVRPLLPAAGVNPWPVMSLR